MGRHTNTPKRLSSVSTNTNHVIDIKARKRIEDLYELTDEIINAYNEINEKYVNQIYRKYRRLQEINKKLKQQHQTNHHCKGCKCAKNSNDHVNSDEDEENEANQPSSTTKTTVVTRRRSQNPFIISDIEDTQNFNANDSRFQKNLSDDDEVQKQEDQTSMDTNTNQQSSDESENDEAGNDNGMLQLPLALQTIIRRKARNRRNPKPYLLQIPRYPALCEYLRDKSIKSFDARATDIEVRPFIEQHISKILALDNKQRMRIRDELREIHRSYLRTITSDPHRPTQHKTKLPVKKSPM